MITFLILYAIHSLENAVNSDFFAWLIVVLVMIALLEAILVDIVIIKFCIESFDWIFWKEVIIMPPGDRGKRTKDIKYFKDGCQFVDKVNPLKSDKKVFCKACPFKKSKLCKEKKG